MSIVKRSSAFLCAVVLCFSFVLGSLSFLPKSFAFSPVVSYDELPSNTLVLTDTNGDVIVVVLTSLNGSPSQRFFMLSSKRDLNVYNASGYVLEFLSPSGSSSNPLDFSNPSNTYSFSSSDYYRIYTPSRSSSVTWNNYFLSSSLSSNLSSRVSLADFVVVPRPVPRSFYFDFSPFYFPELPYGYFDGHLNSVDGTYTIDLGQLQGTTNLNNVTTSGSSVDGGSAYTDSGYLGVWLQDNNGLYQGYVNMDNGEQLRLAVSTTGTYSGSVSGSASTSFSGSGSVEYVPEFDETARFRTWAVVSASSYCYFVCDTRNTITGSLESVSGDMGKFRFSAVGSDGVHYPFFAIEFNYFGTKIQTLSALPNGFTVDFKGGTLEQDSDTGIWSCDPLYHGFWLSDGCPPVLLSSLTDDSYKWLANPVFGESAFTLNFLYAINESINNLNQSITSSISNQTSTFQNMDAPSNFDPTDVNNMLQYGTLESDFHAPSTDDIFSVDSGTFTDGMGFWRDRMNELLFFSGSPALPMTIFSLTLGLAVLIIGRRVSGGGAA